MAPPSSTHRRLQQHQPQNQLSRRRDTAGSSSWTVSGLYDRSQRLQQERERKMEALRMEMLEDYTFTPRIGPLAKPIAKSSNRTFTTKSASSGDSVFSRLYRGGSPNSNSSWSTPKKVSSRMDCHSPAEDSSRVTASSGVSRRMEAAYQKGVTKMRAKPINEHHEKLIRIRNLEDKELKECTFWPKTHWGAMTKKQQSTTRRSTNLVMKPSPARRPVRRIQPQYQATTKAIVIPDLNEEDPPLPKEIIVTNMEPNNIRLHPWDSPQRQQSKQDAVLHPPVSPLRELSLVHNIISRKAGIGNASSDRKVETKEREVRRKKKSSSRRGKTIQQTSDYGSI